jgi:hypothetical protein
VGPARTLVRRTNACVCPTKAADRTTTDVVQAPRVFAAWARTLDRTTRGVAVTQDLHDDVAAGLAGR